MYISSSARTRFEGLKLFLPVSDKVRVLQRLFTTAPNIGGSVSGLAGSNG